jgi:hypothetical protein
VPPRTGWIGLPVALLFVEHDPSGQAGGHAFPKTGVHPRVKPEGRLFRDHALAASTTFSMVGWLQPTTRTMPSGVSIASEISFTSRSRAQTKNDPEHGHNQLGVQVLSQVACLPDRGGSGDWDCPARLCPGYRERPGGLPDAACRDTLPRDRLAPPSFRCGRRINLGSARCGTPPASPGETAGR